MFGGYIYRWLVLRTNSITAKRKTYIVVDLDLWEQGRRVLVDTPCNVAAVVSGRPVDTWPILDSRQDQVDTLIDELPRIISSYGARQRNRHIRPNSEILDGLLYSVNLGPHPGDRLQHHASNV